MVPRDPCWRGGWHPFGTAWLRCSQSAGPWLSEETLERRLADAQPVEGVAGSEVSRSVRGDTYTGQKPSRIGGKALPAAKENPMPRNVPRRYLILAALLIAVSLYGASAAPLTQAFPAQPISSFWSTLACALFGGETCGAVTTREASDSGCGLDPHGGTCAIQSVPPPDVGCGLDPHGADCQ